MTDAEVKLGNSPTYEMEVRVRYDEADPMGFVHHANYLRYFELCRTEALRAAGGNYKAIEEGGHFVVVIKAEVRYRKPARYDDVLKISLQITKVGNAKIEHTYRVTRDEQLLNEAVITLAIIDKDGQVRPVPDWMKTVQ